MFKYILLKELYFIKISFNNRRFIYDFFFLIKCVDDRFFNFFSRSLPLLVLTFFFFNILEKYILLRYLLIVEDLFKNFIYKMCQ